MPPIVLGLDIGGANLKAATADKRAASVPFALWREPDRLPAVLAGLVARFPDADEFAVTMTGELCDCYETKRQGVNAILTAVQNVSRSHPIRVWGTDGQFRNVEEARREPLTVASANWHALATFASGLVPDGPAVLLDVGSTTTDVIPIHDGAPVNEARTDADRLRGQELVYVGVRRTPVCALPGLGVVAELFATTHDAHLVLGMMPEDPTDTGTADGRPATRAAAHARLARMVGHDAESMTGEQVEGFARDIFGRLTNGLFYPLNAAIARVLRVERDQHRPPGRRPTVITSGSGEFLALAVCRLVSPPYSPDVISLAEHYGHIASTCAPAYALAVLAAERRP